MKTFKIWTSQFIDSKLEQTEIKASTEKEACIKARSMGLFCEDDEAPSIKTIRETLESCGDSVYSGTISSNCSVTYSQRTKEYTIWGGGQVACVGSYRCIMLDLNNAILQSIVSELD